MRPSLGQREKILPIARHGHASFALCVAEYIGINGRHRQNFNEAENGMAFALQEARRFNRHVVVEEEVHSGACAI
jgi:hypothetical protein